MPPLSAPRVRGLLLGLLLVGAIVHGAPVRAHPGYYDSAFHAHSVAVAKSLARAERKLIFVIVAEDTRGWKILRWPQEQWRALLDLLLRETITVELSAAPEHASELQKLGVRGPGLILLSEEGARLAELPDGTHPVVVQRAIEQHVSSAASLERLAALLARNPSKTFNRERYAAALLLAGQSQAGFSELEQCLAAGIDRKNRAAAMRRGSVIALLGQHVGRSGAVDVLRRQRDAAAARLVKHPEDAQLARDVTAMNSLLGERDESLRVLDALPRTAHARKGLFDGVSADLVGQRRYDVVLQMADPVAAMASEIEIHARLKVTRPAFAERGTGRGTKSFVLERGLLFIEAVAAEGNDEACHRVIDQLLELDASEAWQTSIQSALAAAGRSDLWEGGQ